MRSTKAIQLGCKFALYFSGWPGSAHRHCGSLCLRSWPFVKEQAFFCALSLSGLHFANPPKTSGRPST
uniref:Uncharacterized protein n=1 Tax=Anguilla anguilla TaxID=7936 RepID=A0A0E9R784_ANGAN